MIHISCALAVTIQMILGGGTILVTGGGGGIGRGLAEAFHTLGNQVIVAGRRRQALDQTTAANPCIHALQLDIEDAGAIREFAAEAAARFPALNVVVNNAGIMRVGNPLKLIGRILSWRAPNVGCHSLRKSRAR